MIKMIKSAVFIVLLFTSGLVSVQAGEKKILSGRELLKARRQQEGISDKQNYEQRMQEEEVKPSSDVNAPAETKKAETQKPEEINMPTEKKAEEKITVKPQVQEPVITEANKPSTELKQAVKQRAGDQLLSLIPAESLFILRVNNLDYALGQADFLLGSISPMGSGASMGARMEMSKLFGSPDLKGINMAGSFALFGLPGTRQQESGGPPQPLIYLLMPMKNYGLFSSGNPNVGKADENGISKITAGVNETLLVKQLGNFALLAWENQYEDFKTFEEPTTTSIAGMFESDVMRSASSGTVWLWINTQKLAEDYGEEMSGQLAALNMMTGGKLPLQAGQTDPATILKELRFVNLAITPSVKMIRLSGIINAVSGSEMAKIISADSPFIQGIIAVLKAQKPIEAGPKLKEITSVIPNARGADFVGTVNLMDLLQPGLNTAALTEVPEETKPTSNLAFSMKFSTDKLSFDIAVSKEQLTEAAKSALPMIMMLGGQQTMDPGIIDANSFGGMNLEGNSGLTEGTSSEQQTISYEEENGTIIAKAAKTDFPGMYGKSGDVYRLPLITMLPTEALAATGGELKKVVGEGGEDLLPKIEFNRRINFPQLAEDKRTVEFTIAVDYSDENIKRIKEAEGTLEYLTSNGTEQKDSGLIDFQMGYKIDALGATIQFIRDNESRVSDTDIGFYIKDEPSTILSAQIITEDGKTLKTKRSGWSKVGNQYTVTYTVGGKIPPKGKIIFETAKDVQTHTIPFIARGLFLTIEKK